MFKNVLDWKVEVVKLQKLQETMNEFEQLGYEIDKYEQIAESYDGAEWVVIGWKPIEDV